MKARMLKWKAERNSANSLNSFDDYRHESIEREHKRIRTDLINKSLEKIPPRFRDKEFKDYLITCTEQVRVKLICERFTSTFSDRLQQGSNAMFLGKPGTGKTLLSCVMYRELVNAGFSAHYEPSLLFLKILQDKLYNSISDYNTLIGYFKKTQFLILDEVSESINRTGVPSVCDKKLLLEIINARYEEKNCCTIVISNCDKQELSYRLGEPIMDRLSENGMALVFNWSSYRQKKLWTVSNEK